MERLCLCTVLALAGAVSARSGSPAGTGPAGWGTVPSSRYAGSMVRTPNPVDNTSNQVVTGNVNGGKAFRGNIPYSSPTSFAGRLGSTSLDPFVRYSAVPPELSEGPAGSSSFYSPTGSVTRMQPGSGSVFAPGSPKVAGVPMQLHQEQPGDMAPASEVPPRLFPSPTADSPLGRTETSYQGIVPLSSMKPDEMRRIIAGAPDGPATDRSLSSPSRRVTTAQEYEQQLEQLQRDFERVQTNASQFEQDLRTSRPVPLARAMEPTPTDAALPQLSSEALRRIMQPQNQAPATPAGQAPSTGGITNPTTPFGSAPGSLDKGGSLLQTRPQVSPDGTAGASDLGFASPPGPAADAWPSTTPTPGSGRSASEMTALKKRIGAVFAPEAAAPERNDDSSKLPAMQRVEETARAFDTAGILLEHPLQDSTGSTPTPAQRVPVSMDAIRAALSVPGSSPTTPAVPAAEPFPRVGDRPPAQGQTIVAVPPAQPAKPDPAAQEKFDQYLKAAQSAMQQAPYVQAAERQTRYAQAAESFARACVYNPRDARPQLGRSHALLAAGDFANSAVCLAKAIELDARSTLAPSDLVEAIGGPDQFVQRITALEQRAKANDAPGLQLLLAYVYQQMGRPTEARQAVQAARKGLPASPAVDLLEAAIGARP